MPVKRFLKDALGVFLNRFAVARNQDYKVPLVNDLDALVEAGLVLGSQVPVEALDPLGIALSGLDACEDFVQKSLGLSIFLGKLAVLLNAGQVEQEIGLDEHTLRLV